MFAPALSFPGGFSPKLYSKFTELNEQLTGFIKYSGPFFFIEHFESDYLEALSESSISMLPNYGFNVTGKETGTYLALDLGGSTLKVLLIKLNGVSADLKDKAQILIKNKFVIPDHQKCLGIEFFNWVADKIAALINEYGYELNSIDAGITWSFPIIQTAHNDGLINECGKGYTIEPDIINHSLKSLFEDSCSRKGIEINVQSLVNDTVSILLSSMFFTGSKTMGLVLGTGTNVCAYLPKRLVQGDKLASNSHILDSSDEYVLFNTELSFFGQFLKPYITKYDAQIYNWDCLNKAFIDNDSKTLFQPLEFLTSGRYISELTRVIIIDLVQEGLIFAGQKIDSKMSDPFDYFTGEDVVNFYNNSRDKPSTISFLKFKLGVVANEDEILIIKRIIDALVERASAILVYAIFALERISGIKRDVQIIGFEGSFLENFTAYRQTIDSWFEGARTKHKLIHINNSSIIGAAVAAASLGNPVH